MQESETETKFPSFLDWCFQKDLNLPGYQWETIKTLSDAVNRKVALHISRNGDTYLHKLWWQYHNERGKTLKCG